MVTEASKLATAAKKKYYEFEYQYTRYNPQLGSYTATSTVIASTEKEAEKFAKMSCDKAVYGHNSFDCIISHGPLLTRDVDYELTILRRFTISLEVNIMYERALFIADLAGSNLASDKEIAVLSEQFFYEFGCHWTEVLN